jgi:hypothetical protein
VNQDMGVMLCMLIGVLFSLVILALSVTQTVLQARILSEVRMIVQKSGPPVSSKSRFFLNGPTEHHRSHAYNNER